MRKVSGPTIVRLNNLSAGEANKIRLLLASSLNLWHQLQKVSGCGYCARVWAGLWAGHCGTRELQLWAASEPPHAKMQAACARWQEDGAMCCARGAEGASCASSCRTTRRGRRAAWRERPARPRRCRARTSGADCRAEAWAGLQAWRSVCWRAGRRCAWMGGCPFGCVQDLCAAVQHCAGPHGKQPSVLLAFVAAHQHRQGKQTPALHVATAAPPSDDESHTLVVTQRVRIAAQPPPLASQRTHSQHPSQRHSVQVVQC
jgi:hypothetical protein